MVSYKDFTLDLFEGRMTEPRVVDPNEFISFGQERSAHAVLIDCYLEGGDIRKANWHSPRIVPYDSALDGTLKLGSKALNYGYQLFEGAKSFMHDDGELYTFRLDDNATRFNRSARMLCMPTISEELFTLAIEMLLDIDRNYFPQVKGDNVGQKPCFYIRPLMFGTEDKLGVDSGNKFTFAAFLSPSGAYYPQGFNPVSLLYQTLFSRAAPGGVGAAKAGGNYAGAARAGKLAKLVGAQQCLFVDAVLGRYCEEVGTSALGIVRGNELVVPKKKDTILDSITSDSILKVFEAYGFSDVGVDSISRENIDISDLLFEINQGNVTEISGFGTAAVVSPVGSIDELNEGKLDPRLIQDVRLGNKYVDEIFGEENSADFIKRHTIGNGEVGPFTKKLYEVYTGIQNGTIEDRLGFLKQVPRRF